MFALSAAFLWFYALFREYEHQQSGGGSVKLSLGCLWLQLLLNGTLCFVHFNIAVNFEVLFTPMMVIAFVFVLSANLYSRMLRSVWRLHEVTVHRLRTYNALKVVSFLVVLFLSQYLVVGAHPKWLYCVLCSDWVSDLLLLLNSISYLKKHLTTQAHGRRDGSRTCCADIVQSDQGVRGPTR